MKSMCKRGRKVENKEGRKGDEEKERKGRQHIVEKRRRGKEGRCVKERLKRI